VKYTCLICGRSFSYLAAWYQHLIRCHPELEPDWARSVRLGLGRKPRLWEVLEEAREEGLVAVVRG
jgi:hypothetical protein